MSLEEVTQGDGFVVKTKWGIRRHRKGCKCFQCHQKRRALQRAAVAGNPVEIELRVRHVDQINGFPELAVLRGEICKAADVGPSLVARPGGQKRRAAPAARPSKVGKQELLSLGPLPEELLHLPRKRQAFAASPTPTGTPARPPSAGFLAAASAEMVGSPKVSRSPSQHSKAKASPGKPCPPASPSSGSGRQQRAAAVQAASAIFATFNPPADLVADDAAAAMPARSVRSPASSRQRSGFRDGGAEVSARPGGPREPRQEDPAAAEALRDLAARVHGKLEGKPLNMRQLMKTGELAGERVQYRSRHHPVGLTGIVTHDGMIACDCRACCGAPVSCSEFEEHAGSRDRRPGDSIILTSISRSLKEVCNAVHLYEQSRTHKVTCQQCGAEGGSLLFCKTCTSSCHEACLATKPASVTDWQCSACLVACPYVKPKVKVKLKLKIKVPGTKARNSGSLPAKPAGEPASTVMAGAEQQPRASLSNGGRVHLAMPSGRGVSAARAERNSHKHRRLFTGALGALRDGESVQYVTAKGERLLGGTVRLGEGPAGGAGILCDCCAEVVSCSQFEAHAGRGSRRAPYDSIYTSAGISLRKLAATLPSQLAAQPAERADAKGDVGALASRVRDVIHELDQVGGGCVLCPETDFQRGGFGPRTILICDQCEREFHVACLARTGRAQLQALPEGEWFCSPECSSVCTTLRAAVLAGPQPLGANHTLQVLRGKDGSHATTWALKAALDTLQANFDPITDLATAQDLLPCMVHAQAAGDWDFANMYTALLKHRGKPVLAAVFRVFGAELAEVPLVCTRLAARRQGHCRVFLKALEGLLAGGAVRTLALPAAAETVGTWMRGFGFQAMPEEQLSAVRSELRLLLFPGTQMLFRPLAQPPPLAPVAQLLPASPPCQLPLPLPVQGEVEEKPSLLPDVPLSDEETAVLSIGGFDG